MGKIIIDVAEFTVTVFGIFDCYEKLHGILENSNRYFSRISGAKLASHQKC